VSIAGGTAHKRPHDSTLWHSRTPRDHLGLGFRTFKERSAPRHLKLEVLGPDWTFANQSNLATPSKLVKVVKLCIFESCALCWAVRIRSTSCLLDEHEVKLPATVDITRQVIIPLSAPEDTETSYSMYGAGMPRFRVRDDDRISGRWNRESDELGNVARERVRSRRGDNLKSEDRFIHFTQRSSSWEALLLHCFASLDINPSTKLRLGGHLHLDLLFFIVTSSARTKLPLVLPPVILLHKHLSLTH